MVQNWKLLLTWVASPHMSHHCTQQINQIIIHKPSSWILHTTCAIGWCCTPLTVNYHGQCQCNQQPYSKHCENSSNHHCCFVCNEKTNCTTYCKVLHLVIVICSDKKINNTTTMKTDVKMLQTFEHPLAPKCSDK